MKHRLDKIAALVNALIVLLAPLALLAIGAVLFDGHNQYSVTVYASDPAPWADAIDSLFIVGQYGIALLPFAAVAGWRTFVHARRWPAERGWQGVVEAGILGLGVALMVLAPGIATRPMDAPPLVLVYGGLALILGLLVGLILRTAAVNVLRWRDSVSG